MDTNGLENLDKEERFKIRDAIVLLQKYGYNISPPQITNENDEYSFEEGFNEYVYYKLNPLKYHFVCSRTAIL